MSPENRSNGNLAELEKWKRRFLITVAVGLLGLTMIFSTVLQTAPWHGAPTAWPAEESALATQMAIEALDARMATRGFFPTTSTATTTFSYPQVFYGTRTP